MDVRQLIYHVATAADGFIANAMDIYLSAGASLAGEMFRERLVDEVILKVNPLLLGAGIPLVSPIGRRIDLELIGSKPYASGVILLSYRVRHASNGG